MRQVFVAVLLLGATSVAVGQSGSPIESFLTPSVRGQIDNYSRCANQHLSNLARINPGSSFDAVEGSLKPMCGMYYEQVRTELSLMGLTREQTNWVIKQTYARNEPSYRLVYQQAVGAEYQRRETMRLIEAQRQRDEVIKAERTKQLEAANQEHYACIRQQMKELVLYSTETADVLTSVVMTKCSDEEQKRTNLYRLINDVPPAMMTQVRQIVSDEMKKFVLAEIVTLRATMNKIIIENSKPDTPKASGSSDVGL